VELVVQYGHLRIHRGGKIEALEINFENMSEAKPSSGEESRKEYLDRAYPNAYETHTPANPVLVGGYADVIEGRGSNISLFPELEAIDLIDSAGIRYSAGRLEDGRIFLLRRREKSDPVNVWYNGLRGNQDSDDFPTKDAKLVDVLQRLKSVLERTGGDNVIAQIDNSISHVEAYIEKYKK
jgi:hypothetical protein